MRMLKFLLVPFVFVVLLVSCKKGDTGPAGAPGVDGNANVTQYSFGAQNLATGFSQLQITTTQDTMNRSAWYVYLYYEPIARWYFVPGQGYGGSTTYRVSMGYASGKVSIYIDKSGTGETYASAKVVRVYANNVTTGGRPAPGSTSGPDFTDYEAVRRYYNLP